MRTLIAIPCMDTVDTLFFISCMDMARPEGTQVAVSVSSLVYNARNMLAKKAIDEGFDRVLWLDSDMKFPSDIIHRLGAHLDAGLEYVSALYFTRKAEIKPVVYSGIGYKNTPDGKQPYATPFTDYPEGLFEIAGSGFGAVMMTTDLIKRCGAQPFFPVMGFGEDFSFCLRAKQAGARMWCDSTIKLGHSGTTLFDEKTYQTQRKGGGTHG